MSARDDILHRAAAAVAGIEPLRRGIPRDYRSTGEQTSGSAGVLDLFVDRLEDYKATVTRISRDALLTTLEGRLSDAAAVVVPAGLPDTWRTAIATGGRRLVVDGEPLVLSAAELDGVDAVVTGCQVAIAETGTIVLDAGRDQGRRALTLVPDHHVVIVRADQVVASVPEALQRLDPRQPLTFISGPSATSDIEFSRVEGVHGPRQLDVVVIDPATNATESA